MTNTELIRQEIERRKDYISVTHFAEELLSIIDSLPKETPTPEQAMQSLDEKIKSAKKSWEGVDADKFMDEVRGRDEAVTDCNGEAFDTEVYLYCQNHFEELTSDRPIQQMVAAIARHFARWMAEQGESVEGEIVKDITNRLAVSAKGIVGKGWHFGDKVIVQIRKK